MSAGIGAAIQGVGDFGAAVVNSRAAGRATAAQTAATDKALQFEREKEEQRRQAHSLQTAQYQAQWDAWNAERQARMRRYGFGGGTTLGSLGRRRTPTPSRAPTIGGKTLGTMRGSY